VKKILVYDENYINENNLYGDVFVHKRLLQYKQAGYKIQVIKINEKDTDYEYQGIKVHQIGRENCQNRCYEYIKKYNADLLIVHFVPVWMFKKIIKKIDIPIIIWIHGVEALGWYRRLFLFEIKKNLDFFRYIKNNTFQMIELRNLIKYSNETNKVTFVFVSNWMKKITQMDALIKAKNSFIIPNPIDTDFFNFKVKDKNQRKNILLIRSFRSKKYGFDIAIKAIEKLVKYKYFNELQFIICGEGKYFNTAINNLKKYNNIKLINRFLSHTDIKKLHDENGVFLCPTRQDSQGVSMCEAMSSGLVPITSNNTAIPEFVKKNASGFLTNNNYKKISKKIIYLFENENIFEKMSKNASEEIVLKCGYKEVIKKEIKLICKIIIKASEI
jgi:glycosyltransferase involved in cell wall biosynthesis